MIRHKITLKLYISMHGYYNELNNESNYTVATRVSAYGHCTPDGPQLTSLKLKYIFDIHFCN